jgi:transposase
MEEFGMPKKTFTQELERARQRGRPRKRWREEVERDLQVLEVRRWRELVIEREKLRGIVRQAKAHSGL